jgi:hypothetical protein
MKDLNEDPKVKFSLVLERLQKCKSLVLSIFAQNSLREIDQIWEAYCDVEEGIALSNFALGSFDRLGVRRKLSVSPKDNPETMNENELRKKLSFVEENVTASIDKFAKGEGDVAAELARKARDVLKAMLIAKSKWEKKKIGKNARVPKKLEKN